MSLLSAEIAEQPDVLARVIERNRGPVAALADALERRRPSFVLIASRGSSGNAARYGQHVFGRLNRLPVGFASPSLHTVYEAPPRLSGALVIGISQSGQSPDVVSVIEDATRQDQITVAVTNDSESPLAQAARHVLPLYAGAEEAVAATKTYTASVCVVAQLAAAHGPGRRHQRRTARRRAVPCGTPARDAGTRAATHSSRASRTRSRGRAPCESPDTPTVTCARACPAAG